MPLLKAEMFLLEDISLNERSFCQTSLEQNNKGILHILYSTYQTWYYTVAYSNFETAK